MPTKTNITADDIWLFFCFGDEEKIIEIFVHKHYAHTHSVYVSYDVITTTTTTTV